MSKIKTALKLINENRGEFWASVLINYFRWIPDTLYLKLLYRFKTGHSLNLKRPLNFSEKLQWLKLNDRRPIYTSMVDKQSVKQLVADAIGQKYIIPSIGVWDKPEDIEWDNLPDQFVLKTTHGGGGGGVVICCDKAIFNKQAAIDKLNKSKSSDIYYKLREWPYKNVPKRILAEKYMKSNEKADSANLVDYKFFCFNGEPKYCQVIRDRNTKETIDFYNMNWQHMDFIGLNPNASKGATPVLRPDKIEEMITICRRLSKDIPFLRVDLYFIDNRIYFGELTFYPFSGFGAFNPSEWDLKLGEMLVLPNKEKRQSVLSC